MVAWNTTRSGKKEVEEITDKSKKLLKCNYSESRDFKMNRTRLGRIADAVHFQMDMQKR